MRVTQLLFLLFTFFVNCFLSAQNIDSIYKKLDEDLLRFKNKIVVKKVDSFLLDNKLTALDINDFKALKTEALTQLVLFPEAISLSNEVLSSKKDISKRAEVRIRIQRAFIFEISRLPEKTLNEINRLEEIYLTKKKDRYYGHYLFSKSSYYRVLKPVEKSDSIAALYALKAANYGDKHKYYDVSAIAKMFQSFLLKRNDYENRAKYLQSSIQNFKLLKNERSFGMMYVSTATVFWEKKEIDKAHKYFDSAVYVAKKTNDLDLKHYAFFRKSNFLESINQKDSALFYYKKYHNIEREISSEKQSAKIKKINFDNEIEKQNEEIISSKKKLETSKKNILFLFLFSLSVFLLLGIIFVLYRRIRKKNKKINFQYSELKASDNQKKTLLKELNHRVKNNLSLIISLIKFQYQEINDSFYKDKFKNLENRITTIAVAHEQFIYSENKVEGKFYNLEEYLQKISSSLRVLSTREIKYSQYIEHIQLNIDTALPIGVLINELISNSIEHAVTKGDLKINLKIVLKHDLIHILYSDSGTTFKVDDKKESLGLFIINSMISQLNGKITRENSAYKIQLQQKD